MTLRQYLILILIFWGDRMKRFTLKPNSIFVFDYNDTVDSVPLPDIFKHGYTDVLTSKKHTYQGDAYYNVGGGLDTESSTKYHFVYNTHMDGSVDSKPVVDFCFCYAYQIAIGHNVFILRTIKQLADFITYVVHYLQNLPTIEIKRYDPDKNHIVKEHYHPKFILWVANFSHEFAFLKGMLSKYEITHFFATDERKPLLLEIGKVLQIRECLGLFGHSLDDIAKHHTSIRKLVGGLDYSKIRTSKTALTDSDIKYMVYDVYILSEMHKKVISDLAIKKDGAIVIPYTSTGYIRNECKASIEQDEELTEIVQNIRSNVRYHNRNRRPGEPKQKAPSSNIAYLMQEHAKMILSETQWNICRSYSYAGGLCGSHPDMVCKPLKNIWCDDLTSDYPAQLNHKKYPAGKMHNCKYPTQQFIDQLRAKNKPFFVFFRCDMQALTAHCVFSHHKIYNPDKGFFTMVNGKVKTGYDLNVCFNDVDIDAYKQAYKITVKEIYAVWYFDNYERLPKYFLNPLNKRYLQKCKLKNEGKDNTQEYSDSKRFVNGFYGMCAYRERYVQYLFKNGDLFPERNKTFLDIKNEFWLNPYVAFWCTSYARSILIQFIAAYPDSIIQYDTDSLYFDSTDTALRKAIDDYNKEIIALNKQLFDDPLFYDLGTFDHKPNKDRFDIFIACGAKKYIKIHDGVATPVIAGLPKNTLDNMLADYSLDDLINIVTNLNAEDFNIINQYHNKLASKYYDCNDDVYIKVTDYNGVEYIQHCSSYHALIPIDFNLRLAPTLKH